MPKRPTHILGISCFFHDAAACLVTDGEIVAAAEEERFTRRKHDPSFPSNAIAFCLAEAGIDATRLDHVVFHEKPFIKFERIAESFLATAPRGVRTFLDAIPPWAKEKLFVADILAGKTGYAGRCLFTAHHEAHAASAYYPSPFSEAAILTVDGVGEWATASWGTGRGNEITLGGELRFPHSLGMLYSAFTYHLGFKVNSGEYKVMGLAPYGEPAYQGRIRSELLDLKEDGSFRLNMGYFDYVSGRVMTSKRFDRLFGGPPRTPEGEITQRHMDLARSIQVVTEEIVLRMARHVGRETGMTRLCMAGGVALNCAANGKLLREGIFDEVW
ncbi:MAG: carbamoyltransferase N-terminal domain-containing protein, partial [bacterium]|nr:carbamoyltransferase N-terminal domain-containing protein [bacterium]